MKKAKKTKSQSSTSDKIIDPRNSLVTQLFSASYCESVCEAESVAETLLIPPNDTGDLNPLIDQLLEFFPQMTKSTATRISFKAFNREDKIPTEKINPELENDQKDSDSSCEDEESLSDSEEYLQDGECELCERFIKLTRHHLIPRVTWKKMKKRLSNISDARSKCDSNRLTALIQGSKLDELVPAPMSSKEIGNLLNNTALICRPCHSMVHKLHENFELAENYYTIDLLLTNENVVKHCKWANKQKTGKYAK